MDTLSSPSSISGFGVEFGGGPPPAVLEEGEEEGKEEEGAAGVRPLTPALFPAMGPAAVEAEESGVEAAVDVVQRSSFVTADEEQEAAARALSLLPPAPVSQAQEDESLK